MGRWLNRIQTQTAPSKPSEPSFDSFDAMDYSPIEENSGQNAAAKLLMKFVQESCVGQTVDPQRVIDELISVQNEQQILNGLYVIKELAHLIRLWIADGMPYLSEK